MTDPPLLVGAVNETVACALPTVAVPMVGAPGTPLIGVTLLELADAAPTPMALLALTVKVYAVSWARPVTEIVVHEAGQVAVKLPGKEVAV